MIEFTSNHEFFKRKAISRTSHGEKEKEQAKDRNGEKNNQLVSTANSHRFLSSSSSFFMSNGYKELVLKDLVFSVYARARIGISFFLYVYSNNYVFAVHCVWPSVYSEFFDCHFAPAYERKCMRSCANAPKIKRKRTVLHI